MPAGPAFSLRVSRAGTPGMARIRCGRPSKSICTVTGRRGARSGGRGGVLLRVRAGRLGRRSAGAPRATAAAAPAAAARLAAARREASRRVSSSLSGSSGLGSPFFSTAR